MALQDQVEKSADDQVEPPVDAPAIQQGRSPLYADPESRVQPVLSLEPPPKSLWPAIRKAARVGAMAMGGLVALALLSLVVETN